MVKKERVLSDIEQLISDIGIDENHMKNVRVKHDSFEQMAYPKGGYNFLMDLVHFPIDPTNKKRYMLVVMDLWSRQFDIEGMTGKTASATMVAFKAILKRKYINLDNMTSIKSDDGSEFKGLFKKWFKMNSVLHSVTLPGRHKLYQRAQVIYLPGVNYKLITVNINSILLLVSGPNVEGW